MMMRFNENFSSGPYSGRLASKAQTESQLQRNYHANYRHLIITLTVWWNNPLQFFFSNRYGLLLFDGDIDVCGAWSPELLQGIGDRQ